MNKRVLIVDDEPINVEILQELLQGDYETDAASDGTECLEKVREFGPDIVLLDVNMPGLDGYEVCRQIKGAPYGELTQVVLVSAKSSTEERMMGYQAGADDYVVKPFDHDELLARIRILFRLRGAMTQLASAHATVAMRKDELERIVEQRTKEIVSIQDVTVFALAKLAESRDPETGEHLERMRSYCQILVEEAAKDSPYASQIDDAYISDLYRSSPLHDIGKVGIPDAILLKPGRLSRSEFETMQLHSVIGADALQSAADHSGSGGFLCMAADIARHHHERFNGEGYPDGLKGQEIPLSARIVALADVFDALTSVRVYKEAFTPEVARNMILEDSGKHFDPVIVDLFVKRWDDFLAARERVNSTAEVAMV